VDPNGSTSARHQGTPNRTADRAHPLLKPYALLQEPQGEPDVDPTDSATVEQLIRTQGIEPARARTGSALTRYQNVWPDLRWYRSQARPRWTTEYERLLRARRETNHETDFPRRDCPCFPRCGRPGSRGHARGRRRGTSRAPSRSRADDRRNAALPFRASVAVLVAAAGEVRIPQAPSDFAARSRS
jgi:hypothetical protein